MAVPAQPLYLYILNPNNIPRHVGVIMDGNGRWAKKRKVPTLQGHNAGIKSMKEIVRHASDIGVGYLTVYAFSTENWKRSAEEVSGIFNLLVKFVNLELDELNENNVKMNILGDYTALPKEAVKSIDRSVELLKNNTGLQFNIALNYGSRQEILDAIAKVDDVKSLTEEEFSKLLYTGELDIPDPELVIRTSGEKRLSNFLMWQSAYSELVFNDKLWPDFTPDDFNQCIEEYQNRKRRFGGR